jgi:hypothetical protein
MIDLVWSPLFAAGPDGARCGAGAESGPGVAGTFTFAASKALSLRDARTPSLPTEPLHSYIKSVDLADFAEIARIVAVALASGKTDGRYAVGFPLRLPARRCSGSAAFRLKGASVRLMKRCSEGAPSGFCTSTCYRPSNIDQ